jgi:alpha-amylase
MKWLTDYITEYGIDGYRLDTVKHTEEFFGKNLELNVVMLLRSLKKIILKKC